MGRIPFVTSPLHPFKSKSSTRHSSTSDGELGLATHDETLFEDPQFEHYEATSNIQLFFDLFFVANLTSFVTAHDVNSSKMLASYVGFISILWFTWCQVSLYDVRFATDSIFERVAHACHFGVMMGLAVIGPNFLRQDAWGPMQQLSLILMVSRLVLACQYGTTLYFTWHYRKTRAPLLITLVSLLAAAAVYFGISFVFQLRIRWDAYIAWYCVSVTEVGINVVVAAVWPALSLEKTHLVERMTCLTLIILGEGIILLTKVVSMIGKLDQRFFPQDIGILISSVLIIYLTYQLYFDNISSVEALGPIGQHLWAMLHFSFHVCLCLMMEGINQIFIWAHLWAGISQLFNPLMSGINSNAPVDELRDMLGEALDDALNRFTTYMDQFHTIESAYNATIALPSNATGTEFIEKAWPAIMETVTIIVHNFGWKIPKEVAAKANLTFQEEIDAVMKVYDLTFGYFCICTGLFLIFITVFAILSLPRDPHHFRLRRVSTGTIALVGLGLALLSLMNITGKSQAVGQSPWVLPALALIMLFLPLHISLAAAASFSLFSHKLPRDII
ncbi:uncharacterized protein BO66DRAFT_433188 [Aspergillus aculeatinus CBS 121060]|uniref:Uncharacterized protein n=1 Tax=Aspergillus aculeatinus CBS 121060 TaxID=1448322 RepID=A0ACD1GQY0_9EURO|nr:hypothetical protein BO66DRAFT_433188 [Aspergillus aculeatinus CBS 121060]RAH63755.1 hypothetical protein BO66DRAFT_433188 [Aspergillus aculeatinus CBS 121060]